MLHQGRMTPTAPTTPTTPIVLTGGTTVFGTAIDNTGTDNFLLYGAGNTVVEGGGNLIVNGGNLAPFGWDTQSTILLGNAVAVNDAITLDGAQNVISGGVLLGSNVAINVTGLGVATPGSNIVSLDNAQGTTSVKLTGKHNSVTLNGAAASYVPLADSCLSTLTTISPTSCPSTRSRATRTGTPGSAPSAPTRRAPPSCSPRPCASASRTPRWSWRASAPSSPRTS